MRDRLIELAREKVKVDASGIAPAVASHFVFGFDDLADAIMREFALRPVSQGKITGDNSEVEPL